MAIQPLIEAGDFSAPTPIVLGIAAAVIAFLVLRFVIKTALTVMKIGILVAIGVAAYLGITFIMAAL